MYLLSEIGKIRKTGGTNALVAVYGECFAASAKNAGRGVLFENDGIAVCEDFDGVFVLYIECGSQLFGNDNSSKRVDRSYNSG